MLGNGVRQRPARLFPYAQHGCQTLHQQPGVGQAGQVQKPGAIGVGGAMLQRPGHSQSCLAYAARSHQGEQATPREAVAQGVQIARAADQARQRPGQVPGGAFQTLQGREDGRQVRMPQLVHLLGLVDIPQAHSPQVLQAGAFGEPVAYQQRSGLRQQHLLAMADGHQACRAVHWGAEEVVVAFFHRSHMQAAADAKL